MLFSYYKKGCSILLNSLFYTASIYNCFPLLFREITQLKLSNP